MASAKPATRPDGSAAGCGLRAHATPDVPSDTSTSLPIGTPSAAPALSPAPGPISQRPAECAGSAGGTTRGNPAVRPSARTSRSSRYWLRPAVEVAGARSIGSIGGERVQFQPARPGQRRIAVGQRRGQPPAQPVVRQADRRGPPGVGRLVFGQPAQLGHRERGQRHRTDCLRPGLRSELGDQVGGRAGRPGVVPQQRRSHHLAGLVQAHHAVLLAGHAQRGHVGQTAGLGNRLPKGLPPGVRLHLGAVRMSRPAGPDQRSGPGVPDHHLAGLGRGIDPGYQRHARITCSSRNRALGASLDAHSRRSISYPPQRAPVRCSKASWLSRTKP